MNSSDRALPIPPRAPPFWRVCAILYVFLSCLDLYLTWLLLERVRVSYEVNPLAAAILERFGWAGLTIFKFGCVAFVLGVGVCIGRQRPAAGRWLLGFGCLSSLVVVLYSLWLVEGGGDIINWTARQTHAEIQAGVLRSLQRKHLAYCSRLEGLVDDLVVGKRTLHEASTDLSAFLQGINHNPVRYLKLFYANLEDEEACLAAHLIRHVGFQVAENPSLAERRLQVLVRQFAVYRAPLPDVATETFASARSKRGPGTVQ